MAKLSEVVAFLDENLRTAEIPDYPGAHNGLQLENASGEVTKVAAAVDASLSVIEEAVELGADLLVVHHGMFWQGVRMVTGAQYRKLKLAMDAGMAVYSSHIPLDVHPEWGNNALLASVLGLEVRGTFLKWKGIETGLRGRFGEGCFGNLLTKISETVGPVKFTGNLDGETGEIGIITGGAGTEIEEVRACGIDTFVTGEGPHWSFPLAEEIGLRVVHAGHYATETYGVARLAEVLAERFGLEKTFIDRPTGL